MTARTAAAARLAPADVRREGVSGRRLLTWAWIAVVVAGAAVLIADAPWTATWAGTDFGRYVTGASNLLTRGDPYAGVGFLYSPAAALVMSPFTLLPLPVGLALWRALEVAALVMVVRGQPLAWAVFLMPWLWASELVGGNMMGFALAAMIAVIRWPSVATVVVYAVMVALVPKPAFLPVMLWGFVAVPEARRYVLALGAFGVAMLAWPGYVDAMLHGSDSAMAPLHWPPLAMLAAAPLTVLGLRWPQLLGPAGILLTPYMWPYLLMPLGTLFARGTSQRAVRVVPSPPEMPRPVTLGT